MRSGFLLLCASLVCLLFGCLGYVFGGASTFYLYAQFGAATLFLFAGSVLSGFSVIGEFIDRSRVSVELVLRKGGLFCLLFAFLVFCNVLIAKNNWRFDTTEASVFSLSQDARALLAELKEPVQLLAIVGAKPQENYRRLEVLRLFESEAPELISVAALDPVRSPKMADRFAITGSTSYVIVFADGKSRLLSSEAQEAITEELLRFIVGDNDRVYFLAGHGEPSIDSLTPTGLARLNALLGSEQIEAKTLLLPELGAVPDDAAAVAIVAPMQEVPVAERKAIERFVAEGGDLMLFLEATTPESVLSLSQQFGIEPERTVVLDKTQRLFDEPEIGWQITTRAYREHEIVYGLKDSDLSVFLLGTSLKPVEALHRKNAVTSFVESPGTAWAESNLEALFADSPQASFDEKDDRAGPVSLAMSARIARANGKESRIVVFGDSTWLRNQNLNVYANEKLAARTFSWAAERSQAVIVRPRTFRRSVVLLSASSFRGLLLSSFVVPQCIFLLGLFVWWRRTRPLFS